jgi:hypothetical protein
MTPTSVSYHVVLATALALGFSAPVALAGRTSPHPTGHVTVHEKEFDAISAFLEKRGFRPDFWVTEPTRASEFQWFYKVYERGSNARLLVMMNGSSELQIKGFIVSAQKETEAKMTHELDALAKEIKRRFSPNRQSTHGPRS